jgi:BMFP domain-containing protein YqiC
MRIFILTTIFASFFSWTKFNQEKPAPKIDSLKIRQSGLKKSQLQIREVKKEFHVHNLKKKTLDDHEVLDKSEDDESFSENHVEENLSDESNVNREITSEISQEDEQHSEDIPFDSAWSSEFGHLIQELEPEQADEIFNAYVTERENFQNQLQELVKSEEENSDLESYISDLENQHEEKLKEILGVHYEVVKEHHTKFLESHSP